MQYLIMLHFPPGTGPQEGTPEFDDEMRRWGELNAEMREAGVMVAASGLPRRRSRRCARRAAS
jgi:hypothetical protein